jgi:hypothetical protein
MSPEGVAATLQLIGQSRHWRAPQQVTAAALHHADLSFALAGEDLYLRSIFKRRLVVPGTYVDIGCAAPVSASNSYLFYSLGWRGICADPNPSYVPKWAQSRPEDIYLPCAVGLTEGPCFFFQHLFNKGRSEIKSTPESMGDDFAPPIPMTMRRLDAIFSEHLKGRDIQFMSIDVESSGLDAIRSNDWDRFRPEIIVLECRDLSLDRPNENTSISFLRDQSYELIGAIASNAYLKSTKAA